MRPALGLKSMVINEASRRSARTRVQNVGIIAKSSAAHQAALRHSASAIWRAPIVGNHHVAQWHGCGIDVDTLQPGIRALLGERGGIFLASKAKWRIGGVASYVMTNGAVSC